jgi:hypothetical protein
MDEPIINTQPNTTVSIVTVLLCAFCCRENMLTIYCLERSCITPFFVRLLYSSICKRCLYRGLCLATVLYHKYILFIIDWTYREFESAVSGVEETGVSVQWTYLQIHAFNSVLEERAARIQRDILKL